MCWWHKYGEWQTIYIKTKGDRVPYEQIRECKKCGYIQMRVI